MSLRPGGPKCQPPVPAVNPRQLPLDIPAKVPDIQAFPASRADAEEYCDHMPGLRRDMTGATKGRLTTITPEIISLDTLTQLALGAAVGEAVLGRKVGNKAILWGAIGGTIPDFDVLPGIFLTDMQAMNLHRGFTHSLFFSLLFAPLFGKLITRIYHKTAEASWKEWGWLMYWALLTHPLLDLLTIYGTQFFAPFSNYPAGAGSVFIIDPLYTVPLIVGVLTAMRLQRQNPRRRHYNLAGLTISSLYLLLGLFLWNGASSVFQTALQQQNIRYERIMTAATPFNTLLWMGIADSGDSLYVGLYSWLDNDRQIAFQRISKNRDAIAGKLDHPAVERLLWFTRGYFVVNREDNRLVMNDLRFGRSDSWLLSRGNYIFQFELLDDQTQPARYAGFRQRTPAFDVGRESINQLFRRIGGDKAAEQWRQTAGK